MSSSSLPGPWIFGYGSLIWRPGFRCVARRAGWIEGWARRLWQRSTDHRGTPEAPGRVATIVPAVGARCLGAVYELDEADRLPVLEGLHVREQQGYEVVELDVELLEGGRVRALTWIATSHNPYFAGEESIEAIAAVVAAARGPSGSNLDYVLELERALAALGAPDDHVSAVARLVQIGRGATASALVGGGAEAGEA